MQDIVTFRSGRVSVSASLIKIDNATYSVSSIGSISLKKEHRNGYAFAVWLPFLILAALSTMIHWSISLILIGAGALISAGLAKYRYVLMIKNSSGDIRAIEGHDEKEINDISLAIERAISHRP